jgi:hypothetical protein
MMRQFLIFSLVVAVVGAHRGKVVVELNIGSPNRQIVLDVDVDVDENSIPLR